MWLSGTWWRCVKNVQFNISCDLWPHMSSSSTRQSIIRLILSGIQLPVMALQGTCLKAIMSNSIWLLRLEWKLDLDSMAKSAEDTGRLKLYSLCDFFFSLSFLFWKKEVIFLPPKNIYTRAVNGSVLKAGRPEWTCSPPNVFHGTHSGIWQRYLYDCCHLEFPEATGCIGENPVCSSHFHQWPVLWVSPLSWRRHECLLLFVLFGLPSLHPGTSGLASYEEWRTCIVDSHFHRCPN